MPQTVYRQRLLERGQPQQRWENQAARGYRTSDLDGREIRRTAVEAVHAGRLQIPIESKSELLRKLHLLQDGKLAQAAVVAFAKVILPGYPQCGLRMARLPLATPGLTAELSLTQRYGDDTSFVTINLQCDSSHDCFARLAVASRDCFARFAGSISRHQKG